MSAAKRAITIILALFAAGGVVLLAWISLGRGGIATDNAYVQGEITAIAPKMAGYVREVLVDDNSPVRAGEVLFCIEDREYRARVEQAQASVSSAEASIAQNTAAITLQGALIAQANAQRGASQAIADQTRLERERQERLRPQGATSEQKYEEAFSAAAQAAHNLKSAQANCAVQEKKLDMLDAQLAGARSALDQARAALTLARLDLENTVVRAPVDGIVGNRKVRAGRYAAPGNVLLDIVPTREVWIVANFKETQIAGLAPGQTVQVRVDSFPDALLHGHIESFAPGSGSVFSLMPPDSATGNFIRVVQRIPIKIALEQDSVERGGLLGRLAPGMSAKVTVHRVAAREEKAL